MPVAAVNEPGSPVVSTGSSTINAGLSSSPHSQTLLPSAAVSTETRVASDPVPDVVGTHTVSSRRGGNGLAARPKCATGSVPVAMAATALPRSIAEPPPSATTAATRSRRANAAAASACAMVGSLLRSLKGTTPKPAAASAVCATSIAPLALSPGSATSSTALPDAIRPLSAEPSVSSVPAPCVISGTRASWIDVIATPHRPYRLLAVLTARLSYFPRPQKPRKWIGGIGKRHWRWTPACPTLSIRQLKWCAAMRPPAT